jgi:hypothetical protein
MTANNPSKKNVPQPMNFKNGTPNKVTPMHTSEVPLETENANDNQEPNINY